jgi:hypothetical protein
VLTFQGPLLLEGRPHAASDFSVGCNMTGAPVAEERSVRPEYPDPVQKSTEKVRDLPRIRVAPADIITRKQLHHSSLLSQLHIN